MALDRVFSVIPPLPVNEIVSADGNRLEEEEDALTWAADAVEEDIDEVVFVMDISVSSACPFEKDNVAEWTKMQQEIVRQDISECSPSSCEELRPLVRLFRLLFTLKSHFILED